MSLLLHDQGHPIGPQATPGQVAGSPGPLVSTGQWHAPDVQRQVLAVDNALCTASKPSGSGRLAPLLHAAVSKVHCAKPGWKAALPPSCKHDGKMMHRMSASIARMPQLLALLRVIPAERDTRCVLLRPPTS